MYVLRHVSLHESATNLQQKQTKNTYTTADPAFPYLLSLFVFLTSLAWSLAEAQLYFSHVLRIAAAFVLAHCLVGSLVVATICYFVVPRLFGRGGALVGVKIPGLSRGRRRGLFNMQVAGGMEDGGGATGEELEFGFCFDVSNRKVGIWCLGTRPKH